VRREWLRRTQAEYRSSAITAQLTLWLLQLGAPPQLIREGLRIVDDELKHAELSYRVFVAAGGAEAAPLTREALAMAASGEGLEHDLTRVATQVFCLGETAAVRLFHRLRVHCNVPAARVALDRILRDEVRHRDFGWALLEWLLSLPQGPALRAQVERALPAMLAGLIRSYGGVAGESECPDESARFASAMRAWGLMPHGEYRQAVALCLKRDLTPRFARLGIHALAPDVAADTLRG
jgi:hypothetical protein